MLWLLVAEQPYSAAISPQPKICRTERCQQNGSGQDRPYRGKFEHALWVAKWLNASNFSGGLGIPQLGPLLL